MIGYVYLTTNLVNGMMYIGSHLGEFTTRYLGSGPKLREDVNRYGRLNFEVQLLEECDTIEELHEAEKRHQLENDVVNSNMFYNMRISCGGSQLNPDESKEILSKKYAGRTWIYNDEGDEKRVSDSDLPRLIDEGWSIGMIHQEGCQWMTNGEQDILAKPEEVSILALEGFSFGRTFGKPHSHEGKIFVTNGTENHLIYPDELSSDEYKNYHPGMTSHKKRKVPEVGATKGHIWITNGTENHNISPDKIDQYPGFYRGRTNHKSKVVKPS